MQAPADPSNTLSQQKNTFPEVQVGGPKLSLNAALRLCPATLSVSSRWQKPAINGLPPTPKVLVSETP